MSNISILGTGSWGSVIGQFLSQKGNNIIMWQRDQDKVNDLKVSKTHPFLTSFQFDDGIEFTSSIEKALHDVNIVIIAVPSHGVRDLLLRSIDHIPENITIINLSKGIEQDSLLTMSQVINDVLSAREINIVSLYGPSHAEEVIRYVPTALVAASKNIATAQVVQQLFSSNALRVYTNKDIMGVELGGSVKNVIAVAAGICDGIGFGDNTKAAILTRGVAEMTRLGAAMGAQEKTFAGLSGIGDLFVTCSSQHSRNRHVGEEIGKGRKINEILAEMDMVAEGVNTAKAVYQLCKKYDVVMPISEAVYNVLFNDHDPQKSVNSLMTRELIAE